MHKFLGFSLLILAKYLDMNTNFIYSSDIKNNKKLNAQDRLIEISEILNATDYINSIGGVELYDKEIFSQHKINLRFLRTEEIWYKQFNDKFVPNLSIIDLLMFNEKEQVKLILKINEVI